MSAVALLAALQAGGNILQGFSANRAAGDQIGLLNARANELGQLGEDMTAAGMKGRRDYGLEKSYQDLRAEINEDPTQDYLTRQSRRIEADQMGSLRAGGARALFVVTGKASEASMDRIMKIAADANLRRRQGLRVVGEAEQRVARERLADARTDLAFGRGLEAEGRSARYGAEDLEVSRQKAVRDAVINGVQGLGVGATAAFGDLSEIDPSLIAMLLGYGGTPGTNG